MNIKRILSLTLLLCFTSSAQAANLDESIQKLNQYYGNEVEKIVQSYDSTAKSKVNIEVKLEKVELPFSALPPQEMIATKDGRPIVQSIKVKIYTQFAQVPDAVKQEIKEMFNWTQIEPQIEQIRLAQPWSGSSLGTKVLTPENTGKFVGYLALIGIALFGLVSYRQNAGRIHGAIVAAANELKNGGMPSAQLDPVQNKSKQEATSSHQGGPGSASLSGFSAESLSSLFYDCYWSEKDQYAKYLWHLVDIQSKTQLLNEHAELQAYFEYISGLEESQEDNYHLSPYYLNPLEINHLSNKDVKDIVLKDLKLFKNLSPIRKQSIGLSPKKLIDASQMTESEKSTVNQSFQQLKASAKRKLPLQIDLVIHTEDEEKELLSIQKLPFSVKEKVASLGWLLELPDQSAKKILSRFSAQEIASSWTGPQDVLKKLQTYIPTEKWQLVESYKEKYPANRHGAFLKIHDLCIKELSQHQNSSNEKPNEKMVA